MAELIEFDPDDPAPLVGHMDTLAASGRGWINIHPGVAVETPVPSLGIFRIFSGRGPAVPLGTWIAKERTRRGVEFRSIGIQHAAGPKAVALLADKGLALPDETLVLADHSRRGLVVAFSVDAPHEDVLRWLLTAMRLLTTVPLDAPWGATVDPA